MADSRKTNVAEAELRWYFGSAAQTAAGDLGLRGIDYAAMAAASEASAKPSADAAEERAARASDAVRRWRRIHARLGRLTERHAAALWLAFGHGNIRPGLSAVARMAPSALRACRTAHEARDHEPTWVELDRYLATAPKRALDAVVAECDSIVREALLAYARTEPSREVRT